MFSLQYFSDVSTRCTDIASCLQHKHPFVLGAQQFPIFKNHARYKESIATKPEDASTTAHTLQLWHRTADSRRAQPLHIDNEFMHNGQIATWLILTNEEQCNTNRGTYAFNAKGFIENVTSPNEIEFFKYCSSNYHLELETMKDTIKFRKTRNFVNRLMNWKPEHFTSPHLTMHAAAFASLTSKLNNHITEISWNQPNMALVVPVTEDGWILHGAGELTRNEQSPYFTDRTMHAYPFSPIQER